MNSGITRVEKDDWYYYFSGFSGSVYQCHKDAYTLRMNNAHVWYALQKNYGDKVELMPEDTDFLLLC